MIQTKFGFHWSSTFRFLKKFTTYANNFALVLIIAFTGQQSYYNGQYMYLFTQQLYIINRSKVTKKCI
jgi:hypothetical protein